MEFGTEANVMHYKWESKAIHNLFMFRALFSERIIDVPNLTINQAQICTFSTPTGENFPLTQRAMTTDDVCGTYFVPATRQADRSPAVAPHRFFAEGFGIPLKPLTKCAFFNKSKQAKSETRCEVNPTVGELLAYFAEDVYARPPNMARIMDLLFERTEACRQAYYEDGHDLYVGPAMVIELRTLARMCAWLGGNRLDRNHRAGTAIAIVMEDEWFAHFIQYRRLASHEELYLSPLRHMEQPLTPNYLDARIPEEVLTGWCPSLSSMRLEDGRRVTRPNMRAGLPCLDSFRVVNDDFWMHVLRSGSIMKGPNEVMTREMMRDMMRVHEGG